ncbi:3-deoxy-D-manno-octulosonate 8-phosphate phosphatase KdsC [Candidatus Hartigia pinicola]|nr:3-deoxy-D-manno-octulosonate 8-phosphate phosphatase KdsC [Candidatus Hartigia pinicola]
MDSYYRYTCYSLVTQAVLKKAAKIKLLISDVDGVMSDGLIYIGNNGEELQAFNTRDGYGIRCLLTSNIEIAIITARTAPLIDKRAKTLGITYLYQGQSNKLLAYNELLEKLKLTQEDTAYIGDDLIDLPVMEKVGLSVAVADAHPLLLQKADYKTCMLGGKGAVRELCDLILFSQHKKQ